MLNREKIDSEFNLKARINWDWYDHRLAYDSRFLNGASVKKCAVEIMAVIIVRDTRFYSTKVECL